MGAGIGGLIIIPLLYGSGILWPLVAFLAWLLVLPRLTLIALALSLVSWAIYVGISVTALDTLANKTAITGTIALSVAAGTTLIGALAYRLVTFTAMVIKRQ